ncbi:MAG: hypothetical protein ACLR2E_17690 [Lachnospiraceae bacterium]
MAETLKERLKACAVGPYRKLAGTLAMKPIHTNASFVDDKKSATTMRSSRRSSLWTFPI